MRRIIEATLLSLDGVMGEPHVWASDYFDDESRNAALEQLLASDAMLMGRRTYEVFSKIWPGEDGDYADRLNDMPKYVFSSTLNYAEWSNATILRGDVATEARSLKEQPGRDLIVYGHGRLARTLLRHQLLDELRIFVHPLVVGHGALLFQEGEHARLTLTATHATPAGVAVLIYEPTAP